jgi:serine beta-lactamase-like protein LACTB
VSHAARLRVRAEFHMRTAILALLLSAGPVSAQYEQLDELIKEQVADKRLPALSIALVDDQKIVWSKGYGFQDAAKSIPATADTVYRVGSVSKLFTDVAVMQLVEQGKLDLDAPVKSYYGGFAPKYGPNEKTITLRMLMAHRSGLIREPPVGNYFDPDEPTLMKSIFSINGLPTVYPPGERLKYSNAAIGLVGYVLQKRVGEKFEPYVQRTVLNELGMTGSSFEPTPAVKKNLADAVMWSYHGREFPAPTFELGTAPAGCMYSSVNELAKFASCLFAGGKANGKQILKPETIREMFRPQFAGKGEKSGFGLGFHLSELDGRTRVGHGGAIYGFATDFAALPEEKLGVIVVCSRDVANATVGRIADDALKLMLAAKASKELPPLRRTSPISPALAKRLAGKFKSGERWIQLAESNGKLYLTNDRGFAKMRLQKIGTNLIIDDIHAWGTQLAMPDENTVRVGDLVYKRAKDDPLPPECPEKWKGLIGEYGWDHNTLYIFERAGRLCALIEWTEIDVLTEESENVFAFPANGGMYHGEKLVFTRDKSGRATQVVAANVTFQRRKIDGENGETFKIEPQHPLDRLRTLALAAKPPEEKGEFLKPDLVDLAKFEGVKFDIRYATENNFLSTKFYASAKAYMQRPAAEALHRAHKKLAEHGYGLLIHDGYRPWFVTKMFRDATPAKFHNFVADPLKGSRHNRGCAVDLTLYDLKTGQPVQMPGGYDEFSDRSFADYPGGTSRQRWLRDLLRVHMENEGFTVYEEEWWHFDYKDWKKYPIGNKTFEELK